MNSGEVRKKYLEFFEKRGHKVIPSSSLVPENDPTTLFTGSGMQPLIPYLLGQKHPMGVRLVDSQKSFRAEDIDEVGDNRHTTFFEMLGNWSLGDYFKEEQLPWFFEFLTEELKLDPKKLYVTVFEGDEKNNIPKDEESIAIWQRLFKGKGIDAKEGERIFTYPAKKNWWSRAGVPEAMPAGEPGGPDSEVFYEFSKIEHNPAFGEKCHPNCDCGRFLEIGNSVFMEYKKKADGSFEKLQQRNVDFGGGLERLTAAILDSPDVFSTDLFSHIIQEMEKLSGHSYHDQTFQKSFRVIADHLRAAIFMIGDGIIPSNTERGYFARRLIRRAVRHASLLGAGQGSLAGLVGAVVKTYEESYPDLSQDKESIAAIIQNEEEKFKQTLEEGLKKISKVFETKTPIARDKFVAFMNSGDKAGLSKEEIEKATLSGKEAFDMFQSYGLPIDMVLELATEQSLLVDLESYRDEFTKHQTVSRTSAAGKFKGGLADTKEETVRLHTAHHLLLAALRKILGDEVHQRGSNITAERLRIDFSHPQKITPEQLKQIEDLVNEKIQEGLDMMRKEMPKEEALKLGAEMEFGVKYGDTVSVYIAQDTKGNIFSKEFCGGPHVKNTSELGTFKILKEEAVSAGIRRIRAVLSEA
ncbi:MAG: hypothetical protein A3A27_02555 [Candidatus Wildermuthbacteria bacterium RIFCSPLOWO2_01_FULL_47_18]|uniref:Alanine--tRNA ligase n=2 Tax=Candidatus Wildermuthiibacteriota TaxID=1817923 RepID=A0A1G2RGT4_9BACT|nr:MAG: hypothetical protein A3J68_01940 [Candidatus Wildermuthbacteria bacterium RIFCSPHIGHO2_02_FULL_48_16]OHA71738.1 MAG: hypothetical protein A3A27_02555 [Candidatus Wildermuthbacteria bacterium RIFCSPLOWO2_01_FULL_47_18]